MKLRKHYLTLRSRFPEVKENIPLETVTAELADLLECTPRTMITLLGRMQQEGWIRWTARRGRANRSELVFLAPVERVALEEAEELAGRKELPAAIDLLRSVAGLSEANAREWIMGHFGVRTVRVGQRRSDVLRFPLPQPIGTLDPARTLYAGESHLVRQLFDGLLRTDGQGRVFPHAAHAWEADAGRTGWTFHLRKGIRFHHGRELTSDDVRYTLERLRALAPHGLFNWVYQGIEAVEAPDEYTVLVRLAEPNELFPAFLASSRASLVPRDLGEQLGEAFGQRPVGSGPYRFSQRTGEVWILEAFADYFQGRGFLDRIEVWTASEPQAPTGTAPLPFQLMHNVRLPERQAQSWQEVRQSGMTCKFLTVPHKPGGALAERSAREAFDRCLNRRLLLERLSGDVADGIDSFWPVRTRGGDGEALARWERAEPERATDVLSPPDPVVRCAGLPPLRLITIPEYAGDAELVREVCAAAGITIEIGLLAAEEFNSEKRLAADLLLFAVTLDEQRELRLIDLFASICQHADAELARELASLMADIRREADPDTRIDLFLEAEELLDRSRSLLFLYRKSLKTAFHPSVRGVSLESLGWVRFRDIWFTENSGFEA
ncbi:ABC transporter substrate-binding protein [Gorillibacterium sp. sgz500922]|uniref:ABC transporter substrate-binding protein n=1 Tax=Gorillibacterium sp. sgz500922 TaxID=3446694 RepID=UPI003F677446